MPARPVARSRASEASLRPTGAFGRLGRHDADLPMAEINMTPLVDVMLVLVVIFMLTAPLLASSVRLDLPRSDAAQPVATPTAITVVVDKTGQAFVADRPVTLAELADTLARQAAAQPDTEVQLRADAAVPHGRIVSVMGVAQKAGLNRIGFVADPLPDPAASLPATARR